MLPQVKQAQWVLIFSSGIFLGFVLFVYKAFGIDQGVSFSGHSLLERVLLFSIVVIATFAFNEIFIKPYLTLKSLRSKVFWIIWEVWSAGTITHLTFNYFWSFSESTLYSYSLLLAEFSAVMIIPYLLYYLINNRRSNQKELYAFKSENEKEEIVVDANHLLFIKADDNYVNIVYKWSDGEKSSILRKKLSVIAKEFPMLIQVHRSYLVNLKTIQRIERKPKSTKVHFSTGSQVPVSETYKSHLIDQLARH